LGDVSYLLVTVCPAVRRPYSRRDPSQFTLKGKTMFKLTMFCMFALALAGSGIWFALNEGIPDNNLWLMFLNHWQVYLSLFIASLGFGWSYQREYWS
jgi:hypothetical protein